jgi:myo-inositol-1(or 4)-monophosphatase
VVGHHAIVTSADFKSQEAILNKLRADHDSLFITEEHVKDKNFIDRLVRKENLDLLLRSNVYIIDELDGSSSFNAGLYDWCVSVGYVENLEHKCGAVFAPQVYGGALFYASKGSGSFVEKDGKKSKCEISKKENLKEAYILMGYDCVLTKYPVHNKLLTTLGDRSRTMTSGPCALSMGLLSAGIIDVVVQPIQSPWDWAAGKVLVEEAGGKILFYEMENGKILPINKIEPKHYDSEKRMLGFVAGNEKLSREVMDLLLEANSSYKH